MPTIFYRYHIQDCEGTLRKCRRLLLTKASFLKTTLKLTIFFCLLVLLFLYFQEKNEKETLVKLALGSGKSAELVLHHVDTLVLNGYADRKGEEKAKHAFIVIAVTSSPENFGRRNIIRSSWGNKARELGVAVIFFLGLPTSDEMMASLSRENKKFQDLVIDDFHESYYGLSVKTLRILKYFKFHHPKSKFLVKTDDDVFVSLPNLINYLFDANRRFESGGSKKDYFVGGVIHSGRRPHTWNSFSKWYVPASIWGKVYRYALDFKEKDGDKKLMGPGSGPIVESTYPNYAEGNFYILSDDAVHDILNVSESAPLYHLEDIFVTGVLANWILKIELEQVPMISSSSNLFPRWSYFWYKIFVRPKDILAFHCDNKVDLITVLYEEA